MPYGVTPEGFVLKRLADIKAEIESDIREEFGEVNLRPDSVFGQLIGVFTKSSADVWEIAEDIYNSLYPATAEGAALDNILDLSNGLFRLPATRTTVRGAVTGDEGTLVPENSQARTTAGKIFRTSSDVTITRLSVLKARIEVEDAIEEHDYIVAIDGVAETYTGLAEQTTEDVASALVALVNAEFEGVTAEADGSEVVIVSDDKATVFSVDAGDELDIVERWTPVDFVAALAGPIQVNIGSLNTIVTPVSGWEAVDNLVDGDTGTDIETDAQARARRAASLRVIGAGTLEAIRSRILNEVPEVSQAAAFENREDTVVDGRPSHSFEIVVFGGDSQLIGEKIWQTKPAGIQTHGNVIVDVLDSNNALQEIKFSRAIPAYTHVEVTYTLYDEEVFPEDGDNLLRKAIFDYGSSLPLGRDLIVKRWFVPIFTVPGIGGAVIRHAVTADEITPPTWETGNIAIGSTHIAVIALDRIIIAEAP